MQKAIIQLGPLTCPSCVRKIEGAVKSIDGVDKESVNVMFNSSKVKFDLNEEKLAVIDVERAIRSLGYDVIKSQVKSL